MRAAILALSFLALATPALAQCPVAPDPLGDQCHAGSVDFVSADRALPSISLDSGWVPAGSPIQVHFGFDLMAETEVDLGGNVVTAWPTTPPMRAVAISVPGRPGTGRLEMAYGFQIVAQVRLHLDVGGTVYDFTGDIPLPGSFPRDLRLAASTTFDPFLLPGAPMRPVLAMDSTDAVRVIGLSVSSLAGVSIPGIDGGIDLSARASLTTSYQTERIDVTRSIGSYISNEGGSVPLPPLDTTLGFGPSTDVMVLPHGRVFYDGVVTMTPAIYVTLAGHRWDLATFDIPLHVVQTDADTHFTAATVHVPLPDILLDPAQIDLDEIEVGTTTQGMTLVRNEGEADLVVNVIPPGGALSVTPSTMRLAPHESRALAVTYAPTDVEAITSIVTLTTNDPDASAIAVRVRASSRAAAPRDAGVADASHPRPDASTSGPANAGGCGCGVAARPMPVSIALALALMLVARRRR